MNNVIIFERGKKIHQSRCFDPLYWVFERLMWPLYYYEEVLELFDFIETERSVEGCMFICKKCGCPAIVREDEAELHKAMIVVKLRCSGCGQSWRKTGIKPIWQTIFEDWDLNEQPTKWIWSKVNYPLTEKR